MLDGTSTLPPNLADDFYWYAPDGLLLEVQVNGDGVWHPTTPEPDPQGVPGFRAGMYGPESAPVSGSLLLRYGRNRFLVRIDGGAPQDGGTVYVGDSAGWVDQYDPAVYSAIITGVANPAAVVPVPYPFAVTTALNTAVGILAALTGGAVHPAGRAVDEFRCSRQPFKLSPQHRPVTDVDGVTLMSYDGTFGSLPDGTWRVRADAVMLRINWSPWTPWAGAWSARDTPVCEPSAGVTLRVAYRFGSTISAAARGAVLHLARQYYLRGQGKNCELPPNTTSVTREGVSISMDTGDTLLQQGRTGVRIVDQWLSTINPGGRRLTRAAVYSGDAPPPTTIDYVVTI